MYLRKISHKTSKTRTIQFSLHNVQNIIQVWHTTSILITVTAQKWDTRNKIDLYAKVEFLLFLVSVLVLQISYEIQFYVTISFIVLIAPLISTGISWQYYGKHVLYYDIVSSKFKTDDSLRRLWVIE